MEGAVLVFTWCCSLPCVLRRLRSPFFWSFGESSGGTAANDAADLKHFHFSCYYYLLIIIYYSSVSTSAFQVYIFFWVLPVIWKRGRRQGFRYPDFAVCRFCLSPSQDFPLWKILLLSKTESNSFTALPLTC